MFGKMREDLTLEFARLRSSGLFKKERVITSPQGSKIDVEAGGQVLNFCANNYLGLSAHPEIVDAAKQAMDRWGYGLSSVRFICGTQGLHKELEEKVSEFLKTEDTILYAACFDANGGVFEPLLSAEDAIISDELNHASIIDGVRLCKASRYRYRHSDMADLEEKLKEAKGCSYRIICTDGVFSMDGDIARLDEICELADRYDSLVMVDDSHATGYIGPTGRGTPELFGVENRIDIITTTFGKALGGASGGCTSGRGEIIEMLRQRSRPYLFSNTLAPAVAGATLKALELVDSSPVLRGTLAENALYFKAELRKAGFDIVEGDTAIIPVMLYEEPLAVEFADRLLSEGIYVIGFVYPVVPTGKARIRVQVSAAHSTEDLNAALAAFKKIGLELGVI
ncbi:MAG: glycine C-acetyltransferase [Spirochaetales bacterium]|jgi:glycine C-acetyltransferase|nr:glycine C-acetyltransferase [Spirochaetales bacterium]